MKNNTLNIYSYNYDEQKNDERITHQLHIDKSGKLYNSYTKQQYPITANLHDGLGFSIAIMQDLKKGIRDIKYTIAEKKKLRNWVYSVKVILQVMQPLLLLKWNIITRIDLPI